MAQGNMGIKGGRGDQWHSLCRRESGHSTQPQGLYVQPIIGWV